MVLSLFIFGVTDIRNFALPLMAGIIAGTYSSIFIASSIWMDLKTKIAAKK
jgi:SecD/SecF fusion protein